MKNLQMLFLILCQAAALFGQASLDYDYPLQAVPLTSVHLRDQFWSARIDINRTVTIPWALNQCEATGRIANFAIAGGLREGKFCGYPFNDSDVFKVIEGASYSLSVYPDSALNRRLDTLIMKIAAAQEGDGYLYTARRLMGADYMPPGGTERWVGEKNGSHELYNAGHLYEAAVAHYLATGKRALLDVARKNADLVCDTFGPHRRHEVPGHQEIEIGLCKLYRLTGDEKYLRTAKFFLDERGDANGHDLIGEYAQDHLPVLQQAKAVGHAVRACYMYSAMADIAAMTNNPQYGAAVDRLWKDVAGTKLYVTGGIGSTGSNEGFGDDYVLPNRSAYCETCASIAFMLWNYRMFLLHGDAKYIDLFERTLYNSFLSGVSLNGDRFFYANPLAAFKGKTRSPWFACACCPSNIVRFIPTIPGYVYAKKNDSIYVNLFVTDSATVKLDDTPVIMKQETMYPWNGDISIKVFPKRSSEFALCIRIPGWAANTAVPGGLYRFADTSYERAALMVNGEPTIMNIRNGFTVIRRKWQSGDSLRLSLPMPARFVEADERVAADRGRVALQRGPIVFCAEGKDNAEQVMPLVLSRNASIAANFNSKLLGGIQMITSTAYSVRKKLDGTLGVGPVQPFTAIPYYGWANRGESEMTVWQASEDQAAYPLPAPTIASISTITVSGGVDSFAVNDQLTPENSHDQSIPVFHWWPKKGTKEWVQYDFPRRMAISGMSVYWFDDSTSGECRVPKFWQALYRVNETWLPIPGGTYGIEKDMFNTITFPPVEADGVKLEIQLQPDFSAGLFEWEVE